MMMSTTIPTCSLLFKSPNISNQNGNFVDNDNVELPDISYVKVEQVEPEQQIIYVVNNTRLNNEDGSYNSSSTNSSSISHGMTTVPNINLGFEDSLQKKHKNSLTYTQRVEVLEKIDKGDSLSKLASEYNVNKSTITRIKKSREEILIRQTIIREYSGDPHKKRWKGVEDSPLEQILYKWMIKRANAGGRITGNILREKALELNRSLKGPNSFKASTGWLHKFKQRHNISRKNFDLTDQQTSESSASSTKSDDEEITVKMEPIDSFFVDCGEDVEEKEDVGNEKNSLRISPQEAFAAVNALINYYEHNRDKCEKSNYFLSKLSVCHKDISAKLCRDDES